MGRFDVIVDRRSGYCSSNGVYYSKLPPVVIPEDDSLDLVSFVFAGQFGDKVALIDPLTGRSFTYKELERNVRALAAGLFTTVGVRQHDVVAILSPNSIDFPSVFLAITWLGAVVALLNPLNSVQELRKQMNNAGAKYIITTAKLLEKVTSANLPTVILGRLESVPHEFKTFSFSDLITTKTVDFSSPQLKQTDVASIVFSSGTSGKSKGVALTHRNYISAVSGYNSYAGEKLSCTLVILPMFHLYGFTWCTLTSLARGISVVVLGMFDTGTAFAAIQRYGVTHMPSVPPMVKALVDKAEESRNFDLRSIKQISCGAAPLGSEILAAFAERYPSVELKQEYGMTESSCCVTAVPVGCSDRVGSSGCLLPMWEAMVVDISTNQPLPPTKRGELRVRGPCVMKEYINNRAETEEAIDEKGWLCTGDIVKFDEEGYLFIVDRLKEMIKYKGYQVAPAEMEDLLASHPAVLDCAVIPCPDKDFGQVPMACIVRRRESETTGDEIMQWVANQVASYKKVRKVVFTDFIPRSSTGKILRKNLQQLAILKSNL
ncbi:probable CoA ligase CCL5 [Physcomitrium patens]|uniref:4-coumarate--CoA ligase n=1 Tax=Physcomitrium patens TaxID=3218 RepID=A0A2K1L7K1_PHYPA|nr:4-coumarate--CoA ligase-like 5 [Physcomitrium patens]XP_024384397.1 4-coumarate--CoA ligase-like 5 [Physcomitrium patens]XP_024384406.1 4-coumarate--CoA ligase-like 5 [Physcomitrium patens]XP_024384415.1 4-coumarate--CoA ligase-like 5 [Physcomitrium patens]PNR62019.1 hypothetical protein PHYPA_000443 [Physcomitrium patens]|eukprot:XP_024384388.1 4-coumarate--CoA ligase-like 5 [Physcomitrella patens]